MAVVLLAGLAAGGFAYYSKKKLDGNIATVDIISSSKREALRTEQRDPEEPTTDLNILVMGSDTREGRNGKGIGGESPGLSDTAMILRIPKDRSYIYGVSIPRDSMVERPTCPTPGGGEAPAEFAMFNSAYALGGPACTVKTLEENTGVFIDHFMVVDFAGFRDIVDLIGGVEMCISKPVNDPKAKLDLEAGTQRLSGKEALGYVRTRYGFGDGSDVGRMQRQQAFLKAVANQTLAEGLLSDPGRTWSLANQGTKLLTTDTEFADVLGLARLAQSIQGLSSSRIVLETTPAEPWPQNPNRLIWTAEAEDVWARLKGDEPVFEKVTLADGLSAGANGVKAENLDKNTPRNGTVSQDEKDRIGLC